MTDLGYLVIFKPTSFIAIVVQHEQRTIFCRHNRFKPVVLVTFEFYHLCMNMLYSYSLNLNPQFSLMKWLVNKKLLNIVIKIK